MAKPYSFNPSVFVNVFRYIDPLGTPWVTVPAMQMTPWLSFDQEVTTWGRTGYVQRFLVDPSVVFIGAYLKNPAFAYRIQLSPFNEEELIVVEALRILDGPLMHCWLVHAVRENQLVAPTTPPSPVISAPISTILCWPGPLVIPTWDFCWGQALNRVTYQSLFLSIGTYYGVGDGVSTFNIPDLRLKFLRGAHSTTFPGWNPGNVGGNALTTLVMSNLPPHNHQMPYSLNLGTSGTVRLGDPGTGGVFTTGFGSGTSVPFSNEPPWLNLNYLIKVSHTPGVF